MATTADIRNGLSILFRNAPHTVVSFQHVKPGKGSAFVRTKLKNVRDKSVIENTFPAGSKIEVVRVERRPSQFLYKADQHYHFMDAATFEMVFLSEAQIDYPTFLKEGLEVALIFRTDTNTPLMCELPTTVWLQVAHTEAGAKGNTATKALKPATLENGAEVQVPLFIDNGEEVKIEVKTGAYSGRRKPTKSP